MSRRAPWRPKSPQRRPQRPKWSLKGHFGEASWSPFAGKFAIAAPCQNLSICYVLTTLCGSGPGPFSLLNAPWGRSTPAEPSFLDFLRPWGRPGDRQGAAGRPKDVRKGIRGHPETTKNQASVARGCPGCPGRSRGYPPRRKMSPKRQKIVSFAARTPQKIRGSDALSAVPFHDDFRLASSAFRLGRP